ncbi:hypothetical protein [Opitutus terrae]|nr:hypothetical protein [Opitutus terrae]
MKLVSLLSRLSLLATAGFAFGLISGHYTAACFLTASSALLLLIMAHDYAPATRRWQPRVAAVRTAAVRGPNRFRLAA